MSAGPWLAFWRNRRGASAVEFAMVAGPLALMMFGTIEFGRLYWTQHALDEVAIRAARCIAIPQPQCSVDGAVDLHLASEFVRRTAASSSMTLEPASVRLETNAECRGLDGFARVDLDHVFTSPASGLMEAFEVAPTLSSSACFPNQPGA